MREQANTAWGLTVSRRFMDQSQANGAVDSLKKAGFREDEIRVWQQKEPAVNSREDAMARVIEGVLAGGVIGGLAVFFLTIAVTWAGSESVSEESAAIGAIIGALAGAIITGFAVTVISRRIAFSHPHEEHPGAGTVVTVTVGEREAEAKRVFDGVS